jgi:hypothetical protein
VIGELLAGSARSVCGVSSPPYNSTTPNGSLALSEYPVPMMRLACRRCERHGRYRVARLVAEHGADVALPDLRHTLAVGCPYAGNERSPCGIYFADLVASDG